MAISAQTIIDLVSRPVRASVAVTTGDVTEAPAELPAGADEVPPPAAGAAWPAARMLALGPTTGLNEGTGSPAAGLLEKSGTGEAGDEAGVRPAVPPPTLAAVAISAIVGIADSTALTVGAATGLGVIVMAGGLATVVTFGVGTVDTVAAVAGIEASSATMGGTGVSEGTDAGKAAIAGTPLAARPVNQSGSAAAVAGRGALCPKAASRTAPHVNTTTMPEAARQP